MLAGCLLGGADIIYRATLHSILWVVHNCLEQALIRMVKALHIDALSFGSETADLDTPLNNSNVWTESTQIVLG